MQKNYCDSGVTAWTMILVIVKKYNTMKAKKARRKKIEPILILKPKTKSAVWSFFCVKSNSNGRPSNTNKPICCQCLEPVAASYGNTSNLFNYLCRKHPLVYTQVHDKKKCKKKNSKVLSLKVNDQQTIEYAFSLG